MKFIHDERAQVGGIIVAIAGLLVIGFFIVVFGGLMDQIQTSNNDMIGNPDMAYSQDHKDAATLNLDYWAGLPIYALVLFAIWGIKNALKREDNTI